jgi:hypothetical protein
LRKFTTGSGRSSIATGPMYYRWPMARTSTSGAEGPGREEGHEVSYAAAGRVSG